MTNVCWIGSFIRYHAEVVIKTSVKRAGKGKLDGGHMLLTQTNNLLGTLIRALYKGRIN